MTTAAWAFLATAWTLIIAAAGYCFFRLLTSPQQLDRLEEEPDEDVTPSASSAGTGSSS